MVLFRDGQNARFSIYNVHYAHNAHNAHYAHYAYYAHIYSILQSIIAEYHYLHRHYIMHWKLLYNWFLLFQTEFLLSINFWKTRIRRHQGEKRALYCLIFDSRKRAFLYTATSEAPWKSCSSSNCWAREHRLSFSSRTICALSCHHPYLSCAVYVIQRPENKANNRC